MASASRNLERGVEDQQVMGSSASGAEDEKGKMEEADLSSKDPKDPSGEEEEEEVSANAMSEAGVFTARHHRALGPFGGLLTHRMRAFYPWLFVTAEPEFHRNPEFLEFRRPGNFGRNPEFPELLELWCSGALQPP